MLPPQRTVNPPRVVGVLDQTQASALLRYDAETGQLTWLPRHVRSASKNNDAVWNAKYAGRQAGRLNHGYVIIFIDRRPYPGHRLAWLLYYGQWPLRYIDHINGNPADNRIANLREASRRENMCNSRLRKNKTLPKGVTLRTRGPADRPFAAQIKVRRKNIYLGYFATQEEAHAAYCEAAQKHNGEFARVS